MMEPPWSNGWHTESNEHWKAEEEAHFDPNYHTSYDPRYGYLQPAPMHFQEYPPPFGFDDANTFYHEDNLGYEMNAEYDQQEMMEMDTNNTYQDMYMYSHDTYATPNSPDAYEDQGITYSEMKDILQQILDIQGTSYSPYASMPQKEPEQEYLNGDMVFDEENEARASLYKKHEEEEGSYWIIDGRMSWVPKIKDEPITAQHESAVSVSNFGDTSPCQTQDHSSEQHLAPIEAELGSCFEKNKEEEMYNCAGDSIHLEDEFNDTPLESSISILNLERPPQDLTLGLPLDEKESNKEGTSRPFPSPPRQLSHEDWKPAPINNSCLSQLEENIQAQANQANQVEIKKPKSGDQDKIKPKGIIEEECQAEENEKEIEEIFRLLHDFNDEELIVASKLKVEKSTKEEIIATKNVEGEETHSIEPPPYNPKFEFPNIALTMAWHKRKSEQVLILNSRLRVFPGKLISRWSGPFRIKEVCQSEEVG